MTRRLLSLALVLGICGASLAQEQNLFRKMMDSQNFLFREAVHPETHLIYCIIDLENPNHWQTTVFPDPAKVRDKVNDDSEIPNLSNCAIAGGRFLANLVDCFEIAQEPACRDQARVVFAGLESLARVSPRPGFIARGLLPGDPGKAHFLNSSVDQYTYYVYGIWKYYHSPLSGDKERAAIRAIMADIAAMIEEDNTILATNGIPARVSDIEAIRSDRSSRMLQMYLVAWDITGDQRWREAYRRCLEENNFARLRTMIDPDKIRYPYYPRDVIDKSEGAPLWGMLQSQTSLVPLFEIEKDLPIRAAYLEALRAFAKLAENAPSDKFSDHANRLGKDAYGIAPQQLEIILLAENRPLFGPLATKADEAHRQFLADWCRRVLAKTSKTDLAALGAYWTAVKRGVLSAKE